MSTAPDKEVETPAEANEVGDENVERAKKLAETNHAADVKRSEELAVPEDENAKTELEAKPELEESKNPEQADLSDEFPAAKVEEPATPAETETPATEA
jgi:hypothetical protein